MFITTAFKSESMKLFYCTTSTSLAFKWTTYREAFAIPDLNYSCREKHNYCIQFISK